MWRCLLVSSNVVQMESSRSYVSRKLSMACVKVLVPFGNLTETFGNCGLTQAPFDPCLFIGEKVIAICYVDDLIFWARNEKDIVELAIRCALKALI